MSEEEFKSSLLDNKSLFLHALVESQFSIYHKLDFLIFYTKNPLFENESKDISRLLKDIVTPDDPKICTQVAWIIFNISRYSFENIKYFISFFTEIQFDEFENDSIFLKPYLMFYLKLMQDKYQDHLVSNLGPIDLLSIAFSIDNSFISITCFKLLKIIYQNAIQNQELDLIINYINSDFYEMTFRFMDECSFLIIQPIISFLVDVVPFIELDKMTPFLDFIPRISEIISSECNLQSFAELLFCLVDKFKVDNHLFCLFLNAINEYEIIDQFTNFLEENEINYPQFSKTCAFLSLEIQKMNEC